MLYVNNGLVIGSIKMYFNKLATGHSDKVYSGLVACHQIMLVACLVICRYFDHVSACK